MIIVCGSNVGIPRGSGLPDDHYGTSKLPVVVCSIEYHFALFTFR